MRSLVRLVVSSSVVCTALAAPLRAQGQWSREFDRPGLLGRVFAVDEHAGELVAGGLAVEADGAELGLAARFDGAQWRVLGATEQGLRGFVVEDFAHYQGELVAAGNFELADGLAVKSIARWDGAQWRTVSSLVGGGIGLSYATSGLGTVYALAVYQNELYAAGRFDRADNVVVSNVARWDGTQWRAVSSGFDGDVYALKAGADGKLYAGGAFGVAGGVSAKNVAAWNGSAWSTVGAGIGVAFNSPVRALEWHAGEIWAGGYFDVPGGGPLEKLAHFNGSAWVGAGNFPDSVVSLSIHALLSVGADLYVGGGIVSVNGLPVERIAKLTGTQWSAIGGVRGFPNDDLVLDMTLHGGELVAGGNFTHASADFATSAPVVSNSIASFDGARWKQIGKGLGFDASVGAGMLWNAGVVAAGSFTEAGRSIAHGLALFDGVDWTPLASFDRAVHDVATFQNELVVTGEFLTVDGLPIAGIAAFDGTSWHGFGASGFNPGYGGQALAVYQNQLYAAGIGGVQRWNGTSWESFAPQIFGSVADLHVHGGVLYIAGYFSLMGGHVASWDGTTQRIVGGGMDDVVGTLASFGNDLVAGGTFTHAGGVPASRIARWNGSAWSAIPGITGMEVTALATFRGELYASGNPLLSGAPFQYVARFDGAQWHALNAGTSGPAGELIPDELHGRLYAAGSFQDADGRPSWSFAAWIPDAVTPGVAFCAGDGISGDHATPCPCGNDGAPGQGCASSVNAAGALLAAIGTLQPETVALAGSGMPATSTCVYLQGDALDDAPFGDGVLCTGGTLLRLRTRTNAGGASTFPDATDTVTLAQRGGVAIGGGARRYYQLYYRNAAPLFCPPATFNVTNGWRIDW